jgi:hypothetical protein
MSGFDTEERLNREHHAVARPGLPRARREWMGRRVAVRYIVARGTYTRRSSMGWAWGVLVPAERDDQIAVRTKHGVQPIHYKRVMHVWDLSTKREQ